MLTIIFCFAVITISGFTYAQNPFNNTYGNSLHEVSTYIFTRDTGFICAIATEYQSGMYNSYNISVDRNGIIEYELSTNNFIRAVWKVIPIQSKYYINSGTFLDSNNMDFLLQKTDSLGNELWIKNFGGVESEIAFDCIMLHDSGFILIGKTFVNTPEDWDVYVVRTDKNGDSLWTRTYGNAEFQSARNIVKETDSTYLLTGQWVNTTNYSVDAFALRMHINGDTMGLRLYGDASQNRGMAMCKAPAGGYVIAGFGGGYSPQKLDQVMMIKLDDSLNVEWEKDFGYSSHDEGYDVIATSDSGFVIVGCARIAGKGEDVYVIRTNKHGDTLWTKTYGGGGTDIAYSVVEAPNGDFAITGRTHSYDNGNGDAFFLRISPNGDLTTNIGLELAPKPNRIKCYPNPANQLVTFEFEQETEEDTYLTLINASGIQVIKKRLFKGVLKHEINIAHLTPGTYFYTISNQEGKTASGKIIVK